jgi:glycine dehydrogenase subunit 1
VTSYHQNLSAEMTEMLRKTGIRVPEELFSTIPRELQVAGELQLPPPLTEWELRKELTALAGKNLTGRDAMSFLGAGIYDHFIPAVVDHLSTRAEFYTAYTPYQPEASQGLLQAFFEYQTLICQLTAMDVANASLYDGASALAEAVLMLFSAPAARRRVLVSQTVHPEYRRVLGTYLKNVALEILEIPYDETGTTDLEKLGAACTDETLCVIAQQPNFFGSLEDLKAAGEIAHKRGARFIAVVDPISLGILKPPGEYGADIVVGEGQPLGLRPYCGGETLGIFACREEFTRRMPGRLVGMTKDIEGRRGFVLTLQTREQHIRREKATSNICTNHALNALRAAIYLAALGKQGIRQVAALCAKKSYYARREIARLEGYELPFGAPAFREFVVRTPRPATDVLHSCRANGILAGVALEQFYPELKDCLLICVTETKSRAEIDRLVETLAQATASASRGSRNL